MSLEDNYAKGNNYVADVVTVLPFASPNRRFLAFILVAVALVALIVLIATLVPIYMTGDGEDKENGYLIKTEINSCLFLVKCFLFVHVKACR